MKRVPLMAICLSLASCGGDGSVSVNNNPSTNNPTTPVAPTNPAITARVTSIGMAMGRLDFYDGATFDAQGNALVQGYTTLQGEYSAFYRNGWSGYTGTAAGGNLAIDYSDRFKVASVIDQQTLMGLNLKAPPAVKIVNPITTLLTASGSNQVKLKNQLGITSSAFRMNIDPDLQTFDPITEINSLDSNRVQNGRAYSAANIRALALVAGLSAADGAADLNFTNNLGENSGEVSRCLNSAPNTFIFIANASTMSDIGDCYWGTRLAGVRPSTKQAIARLISLYAAASPVAADPSESARYLLGIQGYLVPSVKYIVRKNSVALEQEVQNYSTQTITSALDSYITPYTYTGGYFITAPDFYNSIGGAAINISSTTGGLKFNDLLHNTSTPGNNGGILNQHGEIMSVEVPPQFGNAFSVTLNADQSLRVEVAPTFRVGGYFDYVNRSTVTGESRTGRVYVRFFP